MKTILIFDWFGQQELGIYFIEEAPDWLKKCHNEFINATEDNETSDLISRVCDAICENPEHCQNPEDPLAGTWASKKVDLSMGQAININGDFDIVVTGFVP